MRTLSALEASDVERFVCDGCVRLEGAFSHATARACRDILWREIGLSPQQPHAWTQPVIRLGAHDEPPFREAASSPRLHAALDQLVGAGSWHAPGPLGAMVIRFPARSAPTDDGWHIDASYPPPAAPDSTDYFEWRVNVHSRGRALLMLFLFSDCGPDDAPTRVCVGSHLPMARRLARYGEDGISLRELASAGFDDSGRCDVAHATGDAGTVWLLHPFTVHAAQAHRGREPRFIAQPGLLPTRALNIAPQQRDGSAVESAIRRALHG